jgi:hypothetical protein
MRGKLCDAISNFIREMWWLMMTIVHSSPITDWNYHQFIRIVEEKRLEKITNECGKRVLFLERINIAL